ncbi:MAG: lipoate--protein ligase family protein [Candidatus Omnitrophica bacterium]|nr:lipoate--protein ligase family protein [Candidatus Omnitrophota bacterium]
MRAFLDQKFWNLLPLISAPMPFQLALDEVLLELVEELALPLFRFYFASEKSITVGYSEGTVPKKGDRLRMPVYRRITGGGRVEHGRDLLFMLLAKKENEGSFRSVRLSYLKIHEAVKLGMEKLGLQPRFYRCDERLTRGPECFLHPIATDLAWKGRKIAGGAQKRTRGYFLHQESIQLQEVSADLMIPKIKEGFETVFEMKWRLEDLEPLWLERATVLALEKYETSMERQILKTEEAYERVRIFS